MARSSLQLDEALQAYLREHSLREHPAQEALRAATAAHPHAGMQISPEQGQFMALLVKLTGARHAIEVGVFTGYSALTVALALPDDGRLLACDISDEYTGVGRPFWQQAGVAHKIDLRLGPALQTLRAELAAGAADRYDFAFIDADKAGYDAYCECCLQLVRPGGLITIDNTLWGGSVARPAEERGHGRAATAERQAARRRAHRPLAAAGRRRADAGAAALKPTSGQREAMNGSNGPSTRRVALQRRPADRGALADERCASRDERRGRSAQLISRSNRAPRDASSFSSPTREPGSDGHRAARCNVATSRPRTSAEPAKIQAVTGPPPPDHTLSHAHAKPPPRRHRRRAMFAAVSGAPRTCT